MGSITAVYRSPRENDEAGKFFIKEMELKRKYRETPSNGYSSIIVKPNFCFRRNLSLTGLYYHFSNYGESIVRPTIIGAIIVGLSTIFWLIQNNPAAEPSLSVIPNKANTTSNFINLTHLFVWNSSNLQTAFKRSLTDFLPLLSSSSNAAVIDFIVKIVGGALTFVLLGIALRRKFERKYTR